MNLLERMPLEWMLPLLLAIWRCFKIGDDWTALTKDYRENFSLKLKK
jgi:hypothetical protein